MTTVGSLAYSITANSSGFTAGVVASRTELKTLSGAFQASLTPIQRYGMAIRELEILAGKFPQKADVLRSSIVKMRQEMANLGGGGAKTFMGMPISVDPISVALKSVELGSRTAQFAMRQLFEVVGKVRERFGELDRIAKSAAQLSLSEKAFTGLARAAADISGVDLEGFDKSFHQFILRIGQASTEMKGPLFDAFQSLGLSVQELQQAGPEEAFLRVADAISQVREPTVRTQLAFEILGKQGTALVTTLTAGREAIVGLAEDQARLTKIDDINFAGIESANDSVERLHTAMRGLLDVLASEFAPVITMFSNDLTNGLLDSELAGENFVDMAHQMADAIAMIADEAVMLADVVPDGFDSFTGAWGDLLSNYVSGVQSAMEVAARIDPNSFSSRLEAIRKQQEEDRTAGAADVANRAAEDKRMREQARAASEAKRLTDQQAKEAERLSEKAARDSEAERKRQLEQAERLKEKFATPLDKLVSDAQELLTVSIADIGIGGFERAREQLGKQFDKLTGTEKAERQTVGAVRGGSVEALRAQFSPRSTEEKSLEELKRQTKAEEDMRTLLESMDKTLKELEPFREAS